MTSSLNPSSGIASLIVSFSVTGFKTSKPLCCFFPYSSSVFICFANALPSGEYVNLACSIILL